MVHDDARVVPPERSRTRAARERLLERAHARTAFSPPPFLPSAVKWQLEGIIGILYAPQQYLLDAYKGMPAPQRNGPHRPAQALHALRLRVCVCVRV
jgi:hypothetical protein